MSDSPWPTFNLIIFFQLILQVHIPEKYLRNSDRNLIEANTMKYIDQYH